MPHEGTGERVTMAGGTAARGSGCGCYARLRMAPGSASGPQLQLRRSAATATPKKLHAAQMSPARAGDICSRCPPQPLPSAEDAQRQGRSSAAAALS